MEEFSQAVVEERDLVNEKLKMKESEIEQERILRMELCERLKELQNKVFISFLPHHILHRRSMQAEPALFLPIETFHTLTIYCLVITVIIVPLRSSWATATKSSKVKALQL